MTHKITVIGTAFENHHVQKIQETAAQYGCGVDFYPSHDAALPYLKDTTILFGPSDARSPAAAANMPHLQWFASFYAGVDPLLAPGVLPEDVILTNGSGAYGVTIAEHLTMVTLMLLRRNPEYHQLVAEKHWRNDLKIRSIYGSTFVICGTGDIGSKYAQRLRAFCPAKIIGVNRTGRQAEGFDEIVTIDNLDSVLPLADIFVLTCPALP